MTIYESCVFHPNGDVFYFGKKNSEGGCSGKKIGNILHIIKLIKHNQNPLSKIEKIAFDKGFATHYQAKDNRATLTPGIKSNMNKFEKTWRAEPYDRYAIYEAFADLYISFLRWV